MLNDGGSEEEIAKISNGRYSSGGWRMGGGEEVPGGSSLREC